MKEEKVKDSWKRTKYWTARNATPPAIVMTRRRGKEHAMGVGMMPRREWKFVFCCAMSKRRGAPAATPRRCLVINGAGGGDALQIGELDGQAPVTGKVRVVLRMGLMNEACVR